MSPRHRDSLPRVTLVAAGCAGVIVAQQIAGKAVRDALFLSHYPVSALPKAMIAAAILAVPAVLGTSRLLARSGPERVVPAAFAASGGLFLVEWVISQGWPRLTAMLLFLHVAVLGTLLISAFWSVVNESLDPHTAKRAMARIVGGATLGGLVGGVVAERASALSSATLVLPAVALANLVCAAGVARLATTIKASNEPVPKLSGVAVVLGSPYLRSLALLTLCVSLSAATADYVFKAEAAKRLEGTEQLMSFFAMFYTVTSIATFALQITVSKLALRRIGLGGTLALLPSIVLVTGALSAGALRLWSVVLLRASESVFSNAFFRSGYELLYTPLPAAEKRSTKSIIDVAFDRAGDALGSGAVLLVIAFAPPVLEARLTLGVTLLGAAATLWLSLRLHHGYVAELARSLRHGFVRIEDNDELDQTTRLTLSQTLTALDREKLLSQIQELRATWQHAQPTGEQPAPRPQAVPRPVSSLLDSIERLSSPDADTVRAALAERPFDPRAVPFAIELLAHNDPRVSKAAATVLQQLLPHIVGQLVDAMLDASRPLRLRRRIPRVLRSCAAPRSLRGLTDALFDSEFEIRFRAARALLHLAETAPGSGPPRTLVLDAVLRELSRDAAGAQLELATHDEELVLDNEQRDLTLDHVFTLLSLALDREAIRLSRLALDQRDAKLRGTALEYLDNVLPDGIRRALWRRLARGAPAPASRRGSAELLDELRRSMDSVPLSAVKQARASARETGR